MPLVNLDLPADLSGIFRNLRPQPSPTGTDPGGVWMLMPVQAQLHGCGPAPGAAPATPGAQPPSPAATAPPMRVFTRHGPSRAIRFGDVQVLLRDRKGHRYLEHLLVRPFQSLAAVTLKAVVDGCDPAVFSGSLGTTMSAEGLQDLRERYRELIGELEEARAHGGALRQEVIARELERIASECQRATRPGQRLRERSDAEKVRISVTNAVRRGIWAIEQASPPIAQYLQRTIVTGHWLMYRPLGDEVWQV